MSWSPRLLALYLAALLAATHLPEVSVPGDILEFDKLLHLGAYAALALLLAASVRRAWGSLGARGAVGVLVAAMAIGALDEVTQPLVGRSCDLFDWVSDTLGACLGVGVYGAALSRFAPRPVGPLPTGPSGPVEPRGPLEPRGVEPGVAPLAGP